MIMVKLIICDDHQVVLAGLERIFSSLESVEVIQSFQQLQTMVNYLNNPLTIKPDVVLIDAQLGQNENGIESPGLYEGFHKIKWILLSSFVDKYLMYQSRINGFSACISKEAPAQFIISAVINETDSFVTYPPIENFTNSQFDQIHLAIASLTKREREIIKSVSSGKPSKALAEELHISVFTLETHKKNIFRKFEIKSIPELMKIVMDYKLQ
jgi:DNA-binding NarL/FixJ family response regulator